ncbi:LPS export ABC transporter periplasmic protein LptC [Pseudooceanicola nanhaiensis]|uniref:LPS export ABC transporter periplasmic protein LptC n=1 Tax=Pseudooceanicola nanhaiensis TaxID=375761 RepID=UPI001CD663D8|nr:LPS export ABC transporter periplasmic protein LptC [Pseudooceanicola nanhaiensis]MCA0920342.1 LPS export ABC transporter periplasmic protein LptC [Pseudooceanicola nanhaiensis]
MAWREDRYSRVIAWLKVILPLAALGLLSTLFLLARTVGPSAELPFADTDLQERIRNQQITNPTFAGATATGDLIAFTAEVARPDPEGRSRLNADVVDAQIDLKAGARITFRADSGSFDDPADRAELAGNVVITSSEGYRIETEELISALRSIEAETPGTVRAEGPPGRFTAGKMVLTTATSGSDAQLVFTDGVKLVYDPRGNEDDRP